MNHSELILELIQGEDTVIYLKQIPYVLLHLSLLPHPVLLLYCLMPTIPSGEDVQKLQSWDKPQAQTIHNSLHQGFERGLRFESREGPV